MTLVLAARRSWPKALRESRASARFAAVSASLSVAASVMPEPSKSDGVIFCSSASARICADAPWTSTTRMLSERNTATPAAASRNFRSVTMHVHREDERPLAELRNVLQDTPQVGRFHFSATAITIHHPASADIWRAVQKCNKVLTLRPAGAIAQVIHRQQRAQLFPGGGGHH